MRIAILSDIHGNLPAFEAVLEHVDQQRVDQVIIAGDVVNGAPDSIACWHLAQSLNCPILRGNHESYILRYGTADAEPRWATEQFASLRWTVRQLTEVERKAIAMLPTSLRPSEAPNLLVVHASLRSDRDSIGMNTPEEQLTEMFPNVQARFIARGHNHRSQIRLCRDYTIITAGAVGMAEEIRGPVAQYAILEQNGNSWHVQHQSVPYDVEKLIRRFHETGFLATVGPIGRLILREIVLAIPHLVPFSRHYKQWQTQETITLNEAVERFLTMY